MQAPWNSRSAIASFNGPSVRRGAWALAGRHVQAHATSTSNALGGQLSSEPAALQRYRTTHGSPPLHEVVAQLTQAARERRLQPEQVEGGLLALEAGLQGSAEARSSSDLACIPGQWRLVFSTATSFRPFQYIPVDEDLVLDMAGQRVNLVSRVGPFLFNIRGSMRSWDPATGVMEFQFDKGVAVELAGRQIWETFPATKPKAYRFYFSDGTIATARSSAGGLSLLLRN
ncbi:hypothetical protein V8C86DRAFT_2518679 [Haematococcus lacustris]